MKKTIEDKVNPVLIERYNQYISLLDRRIKKQNELIKKAEDAVEKKRLELIKAMQDRKSLDILREKRYAEYVVGENVREQKTTDELVSYRFSNKGNGSG